MIVLCANCHGRKGNRRGQIDRKSLFQYKVNLAVINGRYGETERRVLDHFANILPSWVAVTDSLTILIEETKNLEDVNARLADLKVQFEQLSMRVLEEDLSDEEREQVAIKVLELQERFATTEDRARKTYKIPDGFTALADRFKSEEPDRLEVARGAEFMLSYLVRDGLLRKIEDHSQGVVIDGQKIVEIYQLTEAGRRFVDRWKKAQPLDD